MKPGQKETLDFAEVLSRLRAHRWIGWSFIGVCAVGILLVATFGLLPAIRALKPAATPALPCGQPMLALSTAQYVVAPLARNPDGSLNIPADQTGRAFWVEGTVAPYVLMLAPSAQAAADLTARQSGEAVSLLWADCSREDFVVSAVAAGIQEADQIQAQSAPGILVYLPQSSAHEGITLRGVRPGGQPTGVPAPTAEGVTQADISFLENAVSADGTEIYLKLAIRNTGSAVITIASGDLSLAPADGAPEPPTRVAPPLPVDIGPAQSAELEVTFPNPHAPAVVFRLLDLSMELYY